jgi:DNA-binding NarL/FixJ family response regulator
MAKPAPTPAKPAAIKVAIVHKQTLTRAGLRSCLAQEPGFEMGADGSDLPDLLPLMASQKPDVLLLDEAAIQIVGADPSQSPLSSLPRPPALLLLTEGSATNSLDSALQCGVKGFVDPNTTPEALVQAVRRVAAGEFYLAPELLPKVLTRPEPATGKTMDPQTVLSDREIEIFKLTGQGMEAKEIAFQLGISPRTVDVHRANIRAKLGLDGVHTLMRFALGWEQSRARNSRLERFCSETRPLLLVEDDEVDVLSVRRTLAQLRANLTLQVAKNGEEALAWLRSPGHALPFLVLLDINMPRMNGHEFLAEVRRDPKLQALSVVVLTTSQHEADRERLYKVGIMAYLLKPTNSAEYLEMFRSMADFWGFNTPPPPVYSSPNPPPAGPARGSRR